MDKTPQVEFDSEYGTGSLLCPECGGFYLHQQHARIVNRVGGHEDNDGSEITVFDASRISVQQLPDGEIPGRRDSVQITFTCETCDRESDHEGCEAFIPHVLQIMQHKGQTLIDWVPI